MGELPSGFPLLTLYTFAPALGMLVVLVLPGKRPALLKGVAVAFAAVPAALSLYLLCAFFDTGELQHTESYPWIAGLNIYYRLGLDGLSAPMVVLSGIVGFLAVVASWGIQKQVKGYFALILLLLTGINGVFCALDFFLFYVFWELMLLPMYFLIGLWGGPARVYAAIKFFLYTMAGSVLMLVVLLACWYWSDGSYSDPAAREQVKEALVMRRARTATALGIARRAAEKEGRPFTRGDTQRVLDQFGLSWTTGMEETLEQARVLRQQLVSAAPLPAWKRTLILEQVQLDRTFSLPELRERYELFAGDFTLFGFLRPFRFASLMFIFLFIAFAIKVPCFPFHTWLPWAHVEAPTAVSVILAGLLLKMGVYGFFRISYGLFPTAGIVYAVPIGILAVFSILYGAGCAMAQDDMKKLVAYSSVSHMGFCMLGLAGLTAWGMTGAQLQMFTHGTSTSMLFLIVGVIYDRAHHRDIARFGGLAQNMPLYAGITTLALFASMGLPGLSGFISEMYVLIGTFPSRLSAYSWPGWSFQSLTVIAALGMILTAAYLLWMLQRVFFGPLKEAYQDLPDLSARETFTLVPLAALALAFGVYPQPLIDLTARSTERLQAHVMASRSNEETPPYPPAATADGPSAAADAEEARPAQATGVGAPAPSGRDTGAERGRETSETPAPHAPPSGRVRAPNRDAVAYSLRLAQTPNPESRTAGLVER